MLHRLGEVGLAFNAPQDRAESVRALRRQVLGEAEPLENRRGVGRDDLSRRSVRIERQRQRDETAHDMRVAVTAEMQDGVAIFLASNLGLEPDLARTALHFVGSIVRLKGQRLERAAKLDQVTV